MSEELERLRADLEVLERYERRMYALAAAKGEVVNKIAKLEAEAADPWREAKEFYEELRQFPNKTSKAEAAIRYYDHLTARLEAQKRQIDYLHKEYDNRGLQISELVADNDRLEKENRALGNRLETVNRELAKSEAEYRDMLEEIRDRAAERDEALKRVAELEAEKPDTDPVLDPARVLFTAIGILVGEREFRASASISDAMFSAGISADQPYKLKGGDK